MKIKGERGKVEKRKKEKKKETRKEKGESLLPWSPWPWHARLSLSVAWICQLLRGKGFLKEANTVVTAVGRKGPAAKNLNIVEGNAFRRGISLALRGAEPMSRPCSRPNTPSHRPLFAPVGWALPCLFSAKQYLSQGWFPAFSQIPCSLCFPSFNRYLLSINWPSLKPKRGAKSRVLCSTNWGQALPGAWWVSFASKSGRSVPCNWWGMIGFGHSVKAGSWIWDETGRGPNS